MCEKNGRKRPFFSRDSESAFGSESAIRRGSFWTRIRWGKAVAASGVRGQDAREKWKKTACFFQGFRERVWDRKCNQGIELDGEKLWRHQVFGARMREKNGRKLPFFLGIQRARLAAKVQSGEARFGLELDGEKLWRHQVFGARMREKNGRKLLFFSRDSESAFGSESAIRRGSFWTRIRWGKAVAAPGVRGQDAREKLKKTSFSRDSESAFGIESAIRRGSFWTRSRWGKAVAARPGCARKMEENVLFFLGIQRARSAAKVQSGEARFGLELDGEKLWRHVRGQDAREKWKKTSFFFLGIQRARLAAKVQSGEARFGLELDGEKLWRHQVFGARMREKN